MKGFPQKNDFNKPSIFVQISTESAQDNGPTVDVWPNAHVSTVVGQVAGVAVDARARLHVLHRGERVWDEHSFDANNRYIASEHPIDKATHLVGQSFIYLF